MDNGSEQLTVASTRDGSIIQKYNFKNMVIGNLAHDTGTNKTWIGGFDIKKSQHGVFELEADGTLSCAVPIDAVVEIQVDAYAPETHTFYLTLRDDDVASGASLIQVDVEQKKVLGKKVPLADTVLMMMWSSSTSTMFAWIATEKVAGALVTLDVQTGKTLNTIAEFPRLSPNAGSGASSVLDERTGVVYASLLNLAHNPSTPYFVAVNTATGNHTGSPRAEYALSLAL